MHGIQWGRVQDTRCRNYLGIKKKQFLRWVEYFFYYILGIYIIEHRTFFTLQIIIIQIICLNLLQYSILLNALVVCCKSFKLNIKSGEKSNFHDMVV